jgi:hypothetical protein
MNCAGRLLNGRSQPQTLRSGAGPGLVDEFERVLFFRRRLAVAAGSDNGRRRVTEFRGPFGSGNRRRVERGSQRRQPGIREGGEGGAEWQHIKGHELEQIPRTDITHVALQQQNAMESDKMRRTFGATFLCADDSQQLSPHAAVSSLEACATPARVASSRPRQPARQGRHRTTLNTPRPSASPPELPGSSHAETDQLLVRRSAWHRKGGLTEVKASR